MAKKPKMINPDEVDPSVYYYDEIYDEMKNEEKPKNSQNRGSHKERDRSSKYIQGIKETAELRKSEKELRKFKRYARDREEAEADGALLDKDVYMTSAYKEKLKEMNRMEVEKKRQLNIEKDNSMNFLKKPTDEKERTKTDNLDTPQTSKGTIIGDNKIDLSKTTNYGTYTDVQKPSVRRRLKTLEDRRKYLREILVKRTVGNVYEEAVRRYMERKAMTQK